jgi:hypothetical protein
LEHPNSALGLRLVLASFGVVACTVGWVLLWVAGYTVIAFVLLALAVIGLIDVVVITTRLSRR